MGEIGGLFGEFLWMAGGGTKQGRTRMALIPHAVEEGEVRAVFALFRLCGAQFRRESAQGGAVVGEIPDRDLLP